MQKKGKLKGKVHILRVCFKSEKISIGRKKIDPGAELLVESAALSELPAGVECENLLPRVLLIRRREFLHCKPKKNPIKKELC